MLDKIYNTGIKIPGVGSRTSLDVVITTPTYSHGVTDALLESQPHNAGV